MLRIKEVLEMETALKDSMSLGFFEHGSHSDMDLEIYPAYHAIQGLRMLLEAYEDELRECAKELKAESKDYELPDNVDDEIDHTLKLYDLMDKHHCDRDVAELLMEDETDAPEDRRRTVM